jgi:hypothetical protein
VYKLPDDKVVYNYRYFLPHAPAWGSIAECRQRLDELIEFCLAAKIDAVQFFVNTRWGTYYMPASSVEEQREWLDWMRDEVAPAMRTHDISYQLNFQMLLGAGGWGQDIADKYDWEFTVDQFGKTAEGCPCQEGNVFRKKMGAMLRAWTDTGAEVIWIDDDFRLHNHKLDKSAGMDFYCFCENCLKKFASRVGTFYSRAEIAEAYAKAGAVSALRMQWMDFCRDKEIEFAAWIRAQIDAVNPACRTALMTSLMDTHAIEGRDWRQTLSALSGNHIPMTRPCCGIYTSSLAPIKDNVVTFRFVEQTIVVQNHAMGAGQIEYGPELENCRFTSWANSVASSRYVLELSQLLGCNQITLSLNDLDGSPISEEPTNLPLLHDIKPKLQHIADLNLREWQKIGIACVVDPNLMRKMEFQCDRALGQIIPAREIEQMLCQCGIPIKYVLPTECSPHELTFLDGDTVWALNDAQLMKLLGGSLLLDANAAAAIIQRKMGMFIGATIGAKPHYAVQAECYYGGILPGVNPCRVPHKGFNWRVMDAAKGAVICSSFIDAADNLTPGSILYRNTLGGKIMTLGITGDCGPYAMWQNHARLRFLHGAIQHLTHNTFPVYAELNQPGLCIARRRNDKFMLAAANLSTDVIDQWSFYAPGLTNKKFRILTVGGWQQIDVSNQDNRVRFNWTLVPFEWLIVQAEL